MAGALDRVGDIAVGNAIDAAALTDYCRTHLPGFTGPIAIRQFHGGASNPTYLLTDQATTARYVLRKQPPGNLLASAHAIDREYRVMRALGQTDVPVPEMLAYCDDPRVIGTPFYLMPFLSGRIYADNAFADMTATERRGAYREIARVLASLHALDPGELGLADYGRPGNYYQRQIARWSRQYRESETEHIGSMEQLMKLLPGRAPDDDAQAIVHGDYRQENIMFAADASHVIAVLDWELSTLGHPLADLAFFCQFYHADFMPWGRGVTPGANGVPTEAEFVADYCAAAGRGPIADWNFYLAFSTFRLAAISQGVTKRVADGHFASRERVDARDWADLALRLLEK